jgi:hypothetical protein
MPKGIAGPDDSVNEGNQPLSLSLSLLRPLRHYHVRPTTSGLTLYLRDIFFQDLVQCWKSTFKRLSY